jgi:hypothetical protein
MPKYLSATAQKASLFNTLTTIILFLYLSCVNVFRFILFLNYHKLLQLLTVWWNPHIVTIFTKFICNSGHETSFGIVLLLCPVNSI